MYNANNADWTGPQNNRRRSPLDDNVNNYERDGSNSDESRVSVDQIACDAKTVANAFTAVSLARQEVERRKNAFDALTLNYFNNVSNPVETDTPHTGTKSTNQKMLNAIYKNSPSTLMPFDNSEWKYNIALEIRITFAYSRFSKLYTINGNLSRKLKKNPASKCRIIISRPLHITFTNSIHS